MIMQMKKKEEKQVDETDRKGNRVQTMMNNIFTPDF